MDSASRLSQPYDISTMQDMLGALPSWLSGIGGATEDLKWLNKLLAQVNRPSHAEHESVLCVTD